MLRICIMGFFIVVMDVNKIWRGLCIGSIDCFAACSSVFESGISHSSLCKTGFINLNYLISNR